MPGGYNALPEIRRLLFDGQLIEAHRLFGRHVMGYPVEQQKYQSMGNLVLTFPAGGAHSGYRHQLDLDTAVATTVYERDGTSYRREVFSSPVDQVIVVRLSAEPPGRLSFTIAAARRAEPGALQLRDGLLQDGRRRLPTVSSSAASRRITSASPGACDTRSGFEPSRMADASASRTIAWSSVTQAA